MEEVKKASDSIAQARAAIEELEPMLQDQKAEQGVLEPLPSSPGGEQRLPSLRSEIAFRSRPVEGLTFCVHVILPA